MRLTPATIIALTLVTAHAQTATPEANRREKVSYIWKWVADGSYSPRLVEHFCREHEKQDIASSAFASLIYGYSGSDLTNNMVCSGGGMTARGLMDCTELLYPRDQCLRRFGTTDLHDPYVSIATHVFQAAGIHHSSGREGLSLMRAVFKPDAPDGGRAWAEQTGRWNGIAARFRRIVKVGYRTHQIGGKP